MITETFFKQYIKNFINQPTWKNIQHALTNNLYLDEYHEHNYNKVKGDIFEYIVKHIFMKTYEYVYLYNEIPLDLKKKLKLPLRDEGIDIIVSKDNKNYNGLQCKWRSQTNNTIKEIYCNHLRCCVMDTKLIDGIMVTNVTKINKKNKGNIKWYIRNNLMEDINKELLVKIINENNDKFIVSSIDTNIILRSYQEEAIKALTNSKDRNKQIISACGTGKTVIIMEYLKIINKNKIVILCPSLQLINQTYKILKERPIRINQQILCICSQMDKVTLSCGEATEEIENSIFNEFLATDTHKIFTTDENEISNRLKSDNLIVISTYQSSKLLKDCNFDIGIFDEAHKTVNNKKFGFLLDDKNCKIEERIYFTATPRYYKGKNDKCISMNNENIYGKQLYNYTFKQAISDKYILDYEIFVYTTPKNMLNVVTEKYIKKDDINVEKNELITAIQLAQHILEHDNCKKILTYHNTVARSKSYKKTLNYVFEKYGIECKIFSMDGSTSLTNRENIFEEFKNNEISIICSSRVLNEGVNIPCIDTVLFVDPRKSTIDVTQSVGRAMRPFENANKCSIIIPIHIENIEGEHKFKNLLEILVAMSEIDSNIIDYFIDKNKNDKITIKNTKIEIKKIKGKENIIYDVEGIYNKIKLIVLNKRYFKNKINEKIKIIEKDVTENNKEEKKEAIENINKNLDQDSEVKNVGAEKILSEKSDIPKEFIKDFYKLFTSTSALNSATINIDILIKWFDIKKKNLKATLVNNFKEDYDYKITKIKVPNKNYRGANYCDEILITLDCFKEICMASRTKKAKQVIKYYIEMEKNIVKYNNMQLNLSRQ